ncbi:hypothetical protein BX659_13630 [Orenia metallireducens]|uniref:Uncharacterized protein n=1 Tax=Orenia metallireducens TaxID=1413210 RepID=A0A285IFB4_9FIRM|nr:hypothetical protein [Orenia metallireducens]PRX20151.1 hypothetical protein BX659_13630 [Orenia metallireducens]SNY45766.1 hypothetical protein SAMN06265827_13930 [Orenia metallireducens]
MAICPALPVRIPPNLIAYEGEFIESLQEALNQRVAQDDIEAITVDGEYGEQTAQLLLNAMLQFRNDFGRLPDYELFQITGESIAGCETYTYLGLDCDEVVPVRINYQEYEDIFQLLVGLKNTRADLFICQELRMRRRGNAIVVGTIALVGIGFLLTMGGE